MKKIAVIVVILMACVHMAIGSEGVVVLKKSECDYFLVKTKAGFSLLEWYGGYDPDNGDKIVGKIESYGFHDVYDVSADEEITVWVEEYWLSKSEAIKEYYEECE